MIDITGKKFVRLLVVEKHHQDKRGEWYWRCVCDCGNEKVVSGYKLRTGNTKSCGCLQKECLDSGLHRTHGMTNTRLYTIWCNMKARCGNPKSIEYDSYGGRGISVCSAWLSFDVFAKWALENGYKEGLSIERIDVNGNYCPDNCKWIELSDQSLNQRRSHLLTAFGKTQTIVEWSRESGLKYDTIERRVNAYGWDAEKAISTPPKKSRWS